MLITSRKTQYLTLFQNIDFVLCDYIASIHLKSSLLRVRKSACFSLCVDNKSLPFMAMLRNLRNMITRGISEAHHQKILSRLTNKVIWIMMRQLVKYCLWKFVFVMFSRKLLYKVDSFPSGSWLPTKSSWSFTLQVNRQCWYWGGE